MNYWRMAFRWGSEGPEVWPECYKRGIAATGYSEMVDKDCSKLTLEEYKKIWRARNPKPGTARKSLEMVAYEMKKGDVIFVKQGPDIAGKGIITGPRERAYQYDPKGIINTEIDGKKISWEHFVKVDWEKDFPRFRLLLGSEPSTVLKLEGERLKKILEMAKMERINIEDREAKEGEKYKTEAIFRSRNRALIEAKKANSDYRCEVCGMSFEESYGNIGRKFIIAHHKNPIGARNSASKTTPDDIALVCANCHEMIHRKEPPFSISEIKGKIKL